MADAREDDEGSAAAPSAGALLRLAARHSERPVAAEGRAPGRVQGGPCRAGDPEAFGSCARPLRDWSPPPVAAGERLPAAGGSGSEQQ